jgi:hypothetical protein
VKQTFGDFTPDLFAHGQDGLVSISNAYPRANGYAPVGAYSQQLTALPGPCLGAASFVSPKGTSVILAGTTTGLFRSFSGGWQQIGSRYSIQTDGRWRYVQFGGLAIATNGVDSMQKIDLELGTCLPLGGSPPKSKMLGVVGDFLFSGVINGDVMTAAWAGINNAESWVYGVNQSDFQIEPDGGEITGIVSGEYGLLLQRGCVRRITYVGGNTIFRIDKIANGLGCVSVHTLAQNGDRAFWYSDQGFMMSVAGQIGPIGFEKVNAAFASSYSVSDWPKMSTAIDLGKNTVAFAMPDSRVWIYNWNLDRWSILNVATQIVFSGFTRSISIDEQDILVGANDDILDFAGLISLDDPRFKGGDPRFYVFATDNTMGTLTGTNLAASFQMASVEMIDGADARPFRCRPMSDAVAGITITMDCRQRLGDAPVTKTAAVLNASGEMPVRARGRFIQATLTHAAGSAWTYSQGMDWSIASGGSR